MKMEFDANDPVFYLGLEELMEELGEVDATDPQQADRQVKKLLQETFPGCALGEESVFSLMQSGKTVLEDFLESLAPAISVGAEKCAEQLVMQAKKQAQERRQCY